MKKSISFIIVCIAVFIMSVMASAYILGDADSNGKVTASDARTALRFAASLDIPDEKQIIRCDINGDGRLTAADARTVLRTAASLEAPITKNEEQTFEINDGKNETAKTAHEIYEEAKEFTCEIRTYDGKGIALSIGTGFFVSADGVLVTDFHVIDGASSATATLIDGRKYEITAVLGFDKAKDIALLSTKASDVRYASLNSDVRVGDSVYVLGSTKGYTGTFTQGHVSAVDRVISGLHNGVKYIQMTAPAASGNSGGPVLDKNGNVIAIVAMSHDDAQNLNFAVPVSEIRSIDISSPKTLKEIASDNDDFSGEIVLSSRGITLRKGGTAVIYAVVSASEEYSLVCTSDNDSVTAFTGRNYGNVNVIYISATENCSAEITVSFDGNKGHSASLHVSVSDSAPTDYCGLPVSVPDFGVFSSCAVSQCDENTDGDVSVYSFLYSTDSPAFSSVTAEESMKSYMTLLNDSGYEFVSSSSDNMSAGFFNKANNTSLSFGITELDDGKWYIFVLIYK